ncbi:MAG: glutathione transferase GstA [Myxococcales bacterium]|nr:glutathione transferase GstA [Myxococcales bacterium]
MRDRVVDEHEYAAAVFKLYYAAGGCSISPHIALREVGASFELHTVDLRRKKLEDGSDFAAINPKAQIPALVLPDGQLLTEGSAMVQYIADLDPRSNLAPPPGSFERVRLQEWLNFIATELHKGIAPLIKNEGTEDYRKLLRERIAGKLAFVAASLGTPYLMGAQFTVADGYLFYVLRSWQRVLSSELPAVLSTYYQALVDRPSVKAALLAEGLQP